MATNAVGFFADPEAALDAAGALKGAGFERPELITSWRELPSYSSATSAPVGNLRTTSNSVPAGAVTAPSAEIFASA